MLGTDLLASLWITMNRFLHLKPGILISWRAAWLHPFKLIIVVVYTLRLNEKPLLFFYLMIKNHPFKNGNKRVAVTTLLYFLHTNNRWLNTANENLYEFTKMVAASNSSEKDLGLETIYRFIKRYQIREDRLIIH